MSTGDELIRGFLAELEEASADLPAETRDELLTEMHAHLEEVAAQADASAVQDAIDRLGDPWDIAASAREEQAPPPTMVDRTRDTSTVLTLLLGPVVVALLLGSVNRGLLLIGAIAGTAIGWVRLWTSPTWTTAEKLLGSLVWPGGFVTSFVVMTLATGLCFESSVPGGAELACQGSNLPLALGIPIAVVMWVAPIVVAVVLLRQSDRRYRLGLRELRAP